MARIARNPRQPENAVDPRRRPIGNHLVGEGPSRVSAPFSYGIAATQPARVGEGGEDRQHPP